MKQIVTKGKTDLTVYIFVPDSSSSVGAGLTGLAYNTASLVASYVRPLGSRVAITLATQTVTGAHSDGGFVEVDATNMPGVYRFDLPDAVVATGVDSAVVQLKGAANMPPVTLELQLVAIDQQAAVVPANVTQVSGDSTAADNLEADYDGTGYAKTAVADPTRGIVAAGTLSGTHSSTTADLGTNAPANDISGQTLYFPSHKLARVVDSYNTSTGVATFSPSVAVTLANGEAWVLFASAPGSTSVYPQVDVRQFGGAAGTFSGGRPEVNTSHVAGTAQTAGDIPALVTTVDTVVDTILADTNDLQTRVPAALVSGRMDASVGAMAANVMTAAAAASDLTTELQAGLALSTQVDALEAAVIAIEADTQDIQARLPAALSGGRIDATVGAMQANVLTASALAADAATEIATAVHTTALTEAYSTDGGTVTIAQALYELLALASEFSVSGTTMTVKKRDGSTTAFTLTLDSGTAPTSITRAT